jgi:ergothioneine biosynthesis protein EgtB
MSILNTFIEVRNHSTDLCKNLLIEDFGIQAAEFVSPPKWHLAHTTWFFEQFILVPNQPTYEVKHPQFNFLFNSYYNALGSRTARNQRGLMSRPPVSEVFEYRAYVNEAMKALILEKGEKIKELVILGLNHEQQHQELLVTDLKFSLWHNPLDPSVMKLNEYPIEPRSASSLEWISSESGIFEIGHSGNGFSFDNELGKHRVFLEPFKISKSLVTNAQFLEFIQAGGYEDPKYWHDEGWAWVKSLDNKAPLYWDNSDDTWTYYTLDGRKTLALEAPVAHVSFYEASAFASWKGCRLPTEFEWEATNSQFHWGSRWEWTNSAYLPYPGFQVAPGALGEYNGKFMINQMVLRGASVATPTNHSRATYRNFFNPHFRWQFMGIRLAKSI